MNKLKLKMSNLILFLLLTIIFLSLILTNTNNITFNNTSEYAIKINDNIISKEEFIKRYNFEYSQKINIVKNKKIKNSKNKNYSLKVYNETLSKIINESLLKQYIKKLNFNINNSNIKNYIQSQSIFQTNHNFDYNKYYKKLNLLQISSNEYIEKVKIYLAVNKFIQIISNTDYVLPNEMNKFLTFFSQGRIIQQSNIDVKKLQNTKYSIPIEIKKYFEEYKNKFKLLEHFKINYAFINANQNSTLKNQKKNQDNIIKKLLSNNTNKIKLKQIFQNNNIHIYHTPWLTNKSYNLKKNIPIHNILKYILVNKILFHKKTHTIKRYPIIIHTKNNYFYIFWIEKHKKNITKFFNEIQIQKINTKIAQKIVYELNHKSQNLFKKIKLKFEKPRYYSQFTKNKLTKKIFLLPTPKKGQIIYFSFNNHNQVLICKFLKTFNLKLTKKQKKIISSNILNWHTNLILNAILKNLYKQARISYGKFLQLNTIEN